jgi:hypothetical protein
MLRLAFEELEPCEGKLSRRVLRRLGVSNVPRLPGYYDAAKKLINREHIFNMFDK